MVPDNRAFAAGNKAQGTSKRVLTVCAAGLLRSPTPEFITLDIPDDYDFRDPALVRICQIEAVKLFGEEECE